MLATSIGIQGWTRKSACFALCPILSGSRDAGLIFLVLGVTIVEGQTELQRIPLPAKRRAVCFVNPITAALEET